MHRAFVYVIRYLAGSRQMDVIEMTAKNRYRDAVYGAAVGDALGVPYEFLTRDTFECKGMVGYGTHGQPAGTFSDDTSMMLALCDSITKLGKVDIDDIRRRFLAWIDGGSYAVGGVVFDYGGTTYRALHKGKGEAGERSNGNGSLMRTAPLAFNGATDDEIRAVSAITHAHPISTEACVCFVKIVRGIVEGNSLAESITLGLPPDGSLDFLADAPAMERSRIRSGGYVLDTLTAAIWCLANTDTFADCVLTAVNLGDDSDTTACVAGALAGAFYGYDAIPAEWVETLRGKDIIEACIGEGA